MVMLFSNAPDRDVVLTREERVVWDDIERYLRGERVTRTHAVLASLRRVGWGFVLSFATLYAPMDQLRDQYGN